MTFEIVLVLAILAGAVVCFVTERLPVDLVALLVLSALLASRVLTPEQAISGFSSTATVTVAAMFVLSAGLCADGLREPARPAARESRAPGPVADASRSHGPHRRGLGLHQQYGRGRRLPAGRHRAGAGHRDQPFEAADPALLRIDVRRRLYADRKLHEHPGQLDRHRARATPVWHVRARPSRAGAFCGGRPVSC